MERRVERERETKQREVGIKRLGEKENRRERLEEKSNGRERQEPEVKTRKSCLV